MGIVNTNPANPPQVPTNPNIRPPEYRGVTNDLQYVPRRALLTHIEGAPWEVEYFSQYLNADNAVAPQNINREAVYQQYARIKRMELMVQSGLTTTQDTQSREMTGVGSATTYPGIIPNDGDMFVADGFDGRRYVYGIRNVEQRSILKDTCYTFEFYLVSYDDQNRYGDLLSKISKDMVFVKDFVYTNQRPFLVESEYEFYLKANQFLLDSPERYLKDYVHRTYRSFLVPNQPDTVYDPYIAEALVRLIDSNTHHAINQVVTQNSDTGYPYQIDTVWDGLLTVNGGNRGGWAQRLGLIMTADFAHQPVYASIKYSGITYIYHALGNPQYAGTLDTDYYLKDYGQGGLVGSTIIPCCCHRTPVSDIIRMTELNGLSLEHIDPTIPVVPTIPLITPTGKDGRYVFSQAFYDKGPGQSYLELETNKALMGTRLNRELLVRFMEDSYQWAHLDRFYFLPVLWVLLRTSLSEM